MKTRNLSDDERARIVELLLRSSTDDKIKRGVQKQIAADFAVDRKTVSMLWRTAKKQMQDGLPINVNSKVKGKAGRPSVTFDEDKFKKIGMKDRTTQRRVAKQMGVSQTKVAKWVSDKVIKSHTNALKPGLTDKNKLHRLMFCLSQLHFDDICKEFKFKEQTNLVHIDEKWFQLTKASQRYYLQETEIEPHRTVQSKNFIPKIMFMCAVARPHYSSNEEVIFDGKIGIFPFITQIPAQRNSKNRVAGTLVTKPIDSVNKLVIKECIITQIIPAIKSKWPSCRSKDIIIQQDNARPHIDNLDVDFRLAASSDGFNIQLQCQPPNSPDLNVLDLGFFRAIQSLQSDTNAYKLDDIVVAVKSAFNNLDIVKLKYVFITLQAVMIEIMEKRGGNNYKLPHMHKSKLAAQGLLPEYLSVDVDVIAECVQHAQNLVDFPIMEELKGFITQMRQQTTSTNEPQVVDAPNDEIWDFTT